MMELIFVLLSFFVYYRFGGLVGLINGVIMVSVLGIYLLMGLIDDLNIYFYYFYMDGVSLNLVILSMWVSVLMVLSSFSVYLDKNYSEFFILLIYLLMLVLTITFLVGDYLMFYLFFEISIIPTLLIVIGWGYQPERMQAGVYFVFYTLTASLPLLLIVLFFMTRFHQVSFSVENINFGVADGSGWFYLLGLMGSMAFLVKLPMYFVHLWLPSAHVEAPVAGSMILAGVLLKLGGYGLMRLVFVLNKYILKLSSYFMGVSLGGMLFVGLICCRINDMSALVAYSSVAHMGMVIGGVLSSYLWGFTGSLMMMIGHGLSSSGLFCLVNMYYERLESRSFYFNKGLMLVFPLFCMMIFLLSAANIAAPPTVNLISEIFLMGSIMSYSMVMLMVFPLGSFLGAVFTIYMFSFSQHGKVYSSVYGVMMSNLRELMVLILHVVPVNFLFLNSALFLIL